jgi:gamma-glutamylcyclotransferase
MILTETLFYFAYGSNMWSARLLERTPSAVPIAVARLPGHQLRWQKVSLDGSAKCDAEPSGQANDCVWGVVFRLSAGEKAALDRAEGRGYVQRSIAVDTPQGPLEAFTYVATAKDTSLQPYDWYKALVLAGAREHALPTEYIAAIEATTSRPDPDPGRAAKNRLSLTGAPSGPAIEDPLKPLGEVTQPDSRQASFVGTLAHLHAELVTYRLHAGVPKDVVQLFETAKNLSLYSWFVYRFHQVSELVAFAALEMALREKFRLAGMEAGAKRSPTLRKLLRLAHEKHWLGDQRFEFLPALAMRRIRDRRIYDAILKLDPSTKTEQIAVSEAALSAAEIQAEVKEMRFVEQLWKTVPDVRNLLAHGSAILHPNSRFTLGMVCEVINQLFVPDSRSRDSLSSRSTHGP